MIDVFAMPKPGSYSAALKIGIDLATKRVPPGMLPPEASSMLACFVQTPKNSLLAHLQEMTAAVRPEQVTALPLPPMRSAQKPAQHVLENVVHVELLALPREARQEIVDILSASLQKDEFEPDTSHGVS